MTDEAIFEQEEISDLPDSWVWVTIEDIARTTSGGTPSRKVPEYYEGNIPWVKSGELEDTVIQVAEESITQDALANSSAKIFPAGTPVVAMYGATVGRTGLLGIDAATNQAVCAIFPYVDGFSSKYIVYWLFSQRDNLITKSMGGAQPNINQGIVRAYPFPLAPLNEQRRIVDEIEAQFTRLDAGIAALKRLEANLKRYKASVLKAACEGDLVPQDPDDEPASDLLARILRERREQWETDKLAEYDAKGKKPPKNWQDKYKDPVEPDTDDLPDLPEGWVWTSLDALADVRGGITKGRHLEKYETVDIPYLRVANVQDGYLDLEEIKEITVKADELDKYRLEIGDILFNEGGDRDKLGRGAIWRGELEYCGHQNHVYSARRFSDEIAAEWIDIARRVDHARDYFWRVASQSVNLASINMTKLRYLPVPIPPRSEQYRILDEIDKHASIIEEIINEVQTNLIRAERLRQSILKEAFAGRLVPQDPSDEPAFELLARIRAEREKKS